MRRCLPTLLALLLLLACGGSDAPRDGSGSDVRAGPIDTLLAINGTHLWVHAEGAGDPLVVVHGGPVLDQGYLVGPLRFLARDHRLVFYDQRLSGRSDGTVDSASVTLDTLVADLEALRRQLGLGRIDLLGHSWGGLLAMEYAVAHPEALRSLVLVSPMPPSVGLWLEEQRAVREALAPGDTAGVGELAASEAFRSGDPAAIERMLRLSFRGQMADPSLADSLSFHIEPDYRERSRQFGHLRLDLSTYDLRGDLAGLGVPTLVIYGKAEAGARTVADTLAALVPDAEAVAIPRAGHFSFLERPRAFREAVEAFWNRPTRAGARPGSGDAPR
ncbi:MAG TPA: alpha/beta fold hydrolase [Gemmatimonadota bacterium]|nr:alpha/beta fold hydrolase [Gemmatimonadota bacterium]